MAVNASKARDPRYKNKWRTSGALSCYGDLPKVAFNQQKHPERKQDEVWVANIDDDHFPYVNWKSKRVGSVAYDKRGRPIDGHYCDIVPLFVSQDEVARTDPKKFACITGLK